MTHSTEYQHSVRAQLHYLTNGKKAGHPIVPIYDARPLIPALSLDVQGFALTRCATAVANFYDSREVRAVYYPEVEQLVRQVTGAVRVVAFEHDVRWPPKSLTRTASARRSR